VDADDDLEWLRFIGYEITDTRDAERLTRFATASGDIMTRDRTYGRSTAALRDIGAGASR
jgi:hypothetical protein